MIVFQILASLKGPGENKIDVKDINMVITGDLPALTPEHAYSITNITIYSKEYYSKPIETLLFTALPNS